MTQHTAGPWKVRGEGDRFSVIQSETLNAITGWGNVRQSESDARLIAAAPELLEALETLTLMARAWQTDFELLANDTSYKPEFNKETCRAMEVIAKAKGE